MTTTASIAEPMITTMRRTRISQHRSRGCQREPLAPLAAHHAHARPPGRSENDWSGLTQWKADRERRAGSDRGIHGDRAAHQLREAFDQRQTEAAALLPQRICRAHALELVEHVRQLVGTDADTGVGHGDLDLIVATGVHGRRDTTTLGCELDRVP